MSVLVLGTQQMADIILKAKSFKDSSLPSEDNLCPYLGMMYANDLKYGETKVEDFFLKLYTFNIWTSEGRYKGKVEIDIEPIMNEVRSRMTRAPKETSIYQFVNSLQCLEYNIEESVLNELGVNNTTVNWYLTKLKEIIKDVCESIVWVDGKKHFVKWCY